MNIGLGIDGQESALLTAGAEKVFVWPGERGLVLDVPGAAIREGDTVIMVQPDAIPVSDLRSIIKAARNDVGLQVIGNDEVRDFDAFRAQTPKLSHLPIRARTGRPGKTPYTLKQANAMIRLWHDDNPRRMPKEVAALADTILGLETGTIKPHWVRDLVIKFVGTAQRDKPEGWTGISTDESGEGD
jgi:hypothetical protein